MTWAYSFDLDGDYSIFEENNRLVCVTSGGTEADLVNARLIAAAPELLEALKEAADWIETTVLSGDAGYFPVENVDAYVKAVTAIRKAKEEDQL